VPGTVQAAGGVLWREGRAGPEVALVHRPRHDDWSLPKGKAKLGEHPLVTAVREVDEETGYQPRVGPFVARVFYRTCTDRDGSLKQVRYWSMRAGSGRFAPNDEVDDLAWLSVPEAIRVASTERDRSLLTAFARMPVRTTTLVVVRNADAAPARKRGRREAQRGDRRLNSHGREQAEALTPVLSALGIRALRAAPPLRCRQTLLPYASAAELPVVEDPDLGSPRHHPAAFPATAVERLLQSVAAGPTAACVPGASVRPLMLNLSRLAGLPLPRDLPLRKGGWWLVHLEGRRAVAAERHDPPG
jgi:8-oxo-dGTP pyrophosphatase MutT (NUDIX family)/phosphohistidine phosphatase SixA